MNTQELYDKLFKYVYMKIGDKYMAEDITQETFLRFLKSNSYKEIGKKNAYMYKIAHNLCMDYFRSKPTVELDENIVDQKYEKPKLYIEEALEKLSAQDKELLFLRYTNNESVNDIASYYGVSRFVINRRIKKALANLKEVYENE